VIEKQEFKEERAKRGRPMEGLREDMGLVNL
jgi:hypothetical protein